VAGAERNKKVMGGGIRQTLVLWRCLAGVCRKTIAEGGADIVLSKRVEIKSEGGPKKVGKPDGKTTISSKVLR